MVVFQRWHRHQQPPLPPRLLLKMLASPLICLHPLLHTLPLHPSVFPRLPQHPPVLEVTLPRRRMLCGVGDRTLRCRMSVLAVLLRSLRQLEVLEKQALRFLPPSLLPLDSSPTRLLRRRHAPRFLHPLEFLMVLLAVLRLPPRVLQQPRILPFLPMVAHTVPLQLVFQPLALLIVLC